jgi:hypothetical protein
LQVQVQAVGLQPAYPARQQVQLKSVRLYCLSLQHLPKQAQARFL